MEGLVFMWNDVCLMETLVMLEDTEWNTPKLEKEATTNTTDLDTNFTFDKSEYNSDQF